MAVLEITDTNFEEEVIKAELPALVDFYADWCGPCQMAGPIIEALAEEMEGKVKVCKVNVDQAQETAGKFSVMSIPTVIVFSKGVEVKRQVGFVGREGYVELLKEVI